MSNLLKTINLSQFLKRNVSNRRYNWWNEGIQYPGFKYYPRTPDFKDPPYEPTKLLRVQRVKHLKQVPYYEKHILKEFHLDGKGSDFVVVKNIPENNHRLWKIKHLIKIDPITFPDGFPTDIKGTYLRENGEMRVVKEFSNDEKLRLCEKFTNREERLDGYNLKKDSRLKWLSGWE